MTTTPDPRWDITECRSGQDQWAPGEFEETGVPWWKIYISLSYKGAHVWAQQAVHPDDVDDIIRNPEIFKAILDDMVEKIDEGLDRVDAGEREFDF